MAPETEIRELYLCEIAGTPLSRTERLALQNAKKEPRYKKLFRQLDELYADPNLTSLLKLSPTSRRWEEIAGKLTRSLELENQRFITDFRRFFWLWISLFVIAAAVLAKVVLH